MSWIELEMPIYPRTRRTADATFYTHNGRGRVRVRAQHVGELMHQDGVRHAAPVAAPPVPVPSPQPEAQTEPQGASRPRQRARRSLS